MLAAIIQARTSSTRLPAKIFADIAGRPLIWHVVDHVRGSSLVESIVVATTVNRGDDRLQEWCERNDVECFRGSEDDVLGRFYAASALIGADEILRITADDPMKDCEIIDDVVRFFRRERLAFCYNNKPTSFPEGLDVEVFTRNALETAFNRSVDPYEREHVTPYLYRHIDLFRQMNYSYHSDVSHFRLTIDTADDLEMTREIFRRLYREGRRIKLGEVLQLLQTHPEIAAMNAGAPRSAMYRDKP